MIAFLFIALAFLALLCVLALVAGHVFGAKTPEGQRTAPGCVGGCAMFVVLTGLGLAGLGVFIAGAIGAMDKGPVREVAHEVRDTLRAHRMAERGSQSSEERRRRAAWPESEQVEVERQANDNDGADEAPAPARAADDEASDEGANDEGASEGEHASKPVRVVVCWAGHSEPRKPLLDALREAGIEGEVRVEVEYERDDHGAERTVVTLLGTAVDDGANRLEQHVDAALDALSAELDVRITRVELEFEDLR